MWLTLFIPFTIALLAGCKKAPPPPQPIIPALTGMHPYKNLAPSRIKREVEATMKKESDERDKAIEQAEKQ